MPKRDLDRMRELLLFAEQFESPVDHDMDAGLIDMDDLMRSHSDN